MAGLETRLSVRSVAATSSSLLSRPYCAAITSYPSACSGGITLLKHEPSAQIPCAKTMLGLAGMAAPSRERSGRLHARSRPCLRHRTNARFLWAHQAIMFDLDACTQLLEDRDGGAHDDLRCSGSGAGGSNRERYGQFVPDPGAGRAVAHDHRSYRA